MSLISARQVRAARALLGLTQRDLAASLSISEPTMKRIESEDWGPARSAAGTVAAIQSQLEAKGVIFLAEDDEHGDGVRMRRSKNGRGTQDPI